MGGFLDMFLPGGSNLSADQQSAAANAGLLNASLALINASGNHYGLRPSTLQVLGQGVAGYGQGVGNYATTMADQQQNLAKGQMADLQAQRALQYFYPQGKGNGMAAALASPTPGTSPGGGLSSFYGPSAPSQAIPPVPGSPVAPGYGQQSGGTFPPAAAGAAAPGGQQTAFGTDVPTMARTLYKQGIDTMMMGQPGGDVLIKQAMEMDPTIIASSEGAKAGADYPFELGKIGATGAQARQTETQKAAITPYQQTVMMGGQPTQIATNNLAAAGGQIPMGAGANNVPLDGIPPVSSSALQPPQVSTSVPVGAQQKAEKLAQTAAETTMSAQDVTNKANDMRQNIGKMVDLLSGLKQYTGASTPSSANTRAWLERNNPMMAKPLNDAYAQLNQLGSGTLLPSIKEFLQGTGQVRVFEGQNLQKMFEFDPDEPLSSNIKKLQQALPQIDRMEQSALRNVQAAQTGQVQPVTNANPVANAGWAIKRVQ